ncbi:similar to novel protein (predicted), isoform CRA_e [Rattus norvegicus]|uniref:Similar to novel protein (Predicted), isoform CRA_e n=1 Tax=Rattus norvegicus TaxID=10116 RepID=A6HF08_RAT|nr:similar to novel protein (predicted), isoform CRA_e [Rattus norvegicus]
MYVGITNLEVANKHTQWFEINQVIIHPTFEMFHPVGGDVALVQSKSAIVFSDYVLPICLPSSNLNLSDLSCWTTGWGMVSPQVLRLWALLQPERGLCGGEGMDSHSAPEGHT